jgi:hypothetical protein
MENLNRKDLIEGKSYIHINGFDGTKTEFVYVGKTDYAMHTVVITTGVEGGVKSFLVPGDVIMPIEGLNMRTKEKKTQNNLKESMSQGVGNMIAQSDRDRERAYQESLREENRGSGFPPKRTKYS